MEAEESGLAAEVFRAAKAMAFFLLSENGGIKGAAMFDEVMDDPGELVGRGGNGSGCAQPGLHPAVVVAECGLATLKVPGSHAQGLGGTAFDVAGAGGEDTASRDAVVRRRVEVGL